MDTEDSLFITFGMKLLVPMGFLQVQQTKHFSCHCRLLYSIFFIPAWNITFLNIQVYDL